MEQVLEGGGTDLIGEQLGIGKWGRRVIERNIFRGKPDWSPVFSYMSLSQEMDQGS